MKKIRMLAAMFVRMPKWSIRILKSFIIPVTTPHASTFGWMYQEEIGNEQ